MLIYFSFLSFDLFSFFFFLFKIYFIQESNRAFQSTSIVPSADCSLQLFIILSLLWDWASAHHIEWLWWAIYSWFTAPISEYICFFVKSILYVAGSPIHNSCIPPSSTRDYLLATTQVTIMTIQTLRLHYTCFGDCFDYFCKLISPTSFRNVQEST